MVSTQPTSSPCSRASSDPYDVVVVGAGVAGSSLAFALGSIGKTALVIERDLSMPDRIVGELLQPGGFNALKQLGLEGTTVGIDSQVVKGYVVIMDNQEVVINYPRIGDKEQEGRSFHHGRFVQNLRDAARGHSGVELVEGTVKDLIEDAGVVRGVRYKDREGIKEAKAHMTIVCDGCFSSFRKTVSEVPKPEAPSTFVALMLRDVDVPFKGYGHVILADPSPVLVYQIGEREIRVLVDVAGSKLPQRDDLKDHLLNHVMPQLPQCLQIAFRNSVEERIRSRGNFVLPGSARARPGVLLLGDAYNMRHPLTGGGMTVAFNDVVLIRDLLKEVDDISDVDDVVQRLSAFYTERKPLAATINVLASALHSVFCIDEKDPHVSHDLRVACFNYLQQGGWYSDGPIGFLSGLNPSPSFLVTHFFNVALFAVKGELKPYPSTSGLVKSFRMLRRAANIMLPLLDTEKVTALRFIRPFLTLGLK